MVLDTTGEASLEWTRYPYGPQANTPGVSIQNKTHDEYIKGSSIYVTFVTNYVYGVEFRFGYCTNSIPIYKNIVLTRI